MSVSDRFSTHNNNMANALRAVRERVFAVEGPSGLERPPTPRRGVFTDRLAAFRAALLGTLGPCTPWTTYQFLDSYKGSKLRRYQQAVTSLLARGITRRDAYLSSFVKAELFNFSAKPDPAPRIIQPRSPRYNACVGRFLRPLEHRIYHAIGEVWGGPTVMKGYNAFDTAQIMHQKWSMFNKPRSVALDASRFDQHISVDALKWEHGVYNALYRDKELSRLLKWQLENTGYVRTPDGVFRYTVKGCRMSGDMNTALGNCLIMCALVYSYAMSRGIKCALANNGDDCAVFMEAGDVNRFVDGIPTWFREMGFTMKVEGVSDTFECVDFCQTRPVWRGDGYVMCRSPVTGMAKDTTWKTPDMGSPLAGYRRWMYQVGLAGLSLTDGLPVFPQFYSAFVRTGIKCKRAQGFGNMESGFEHMARGMNSAKRAVSPESRVSFWRAWGITPDLQMAMETMYERLSTLEAVEPRMSEIDHPGIWIPRC